MFIALTIAGQIAKYFTYINTFIFQKATKWIVCPFIDGETEVYGVYVNLCKVTLLGFETKLRLYCLRLTVKTLLFNTTILFDHYVSTYRN